jgi:hypothetical protein
MAVIDVKNDWLEQIGEQMPGHRMWKYTMRRPYGYETITFWSKPGDWPAHGDSVVDGLLVKVVKPKPVVYEMRQPSSGLPYYDTTPEENWGYGTT